MCALNEMEKSTASHLSTYERQQIIHFWREGKNVTEIVAKWSLREEDHRVQQYENGYFDGLLDQHRCGTKSKIMPAVAAYVEGKIEGDNEVISVEFQRLIAEILPRNQPIDVLP